MKTQSRDTSMEAEKVQIELLRDLSIAKRFGMVRRLTNSTRKMAKMAIKKCNPGKDDRELSLIFAEVIYGQNVAEALRKYYYSR